MEQAIQLLLKEAGKNVTSKLDTMPDQTPGGSLSPETYVGANRMQYYYPSGALGAGKQTLHLSGTLAPNSFSLGGNWDIQKEYAVTGKNAVLNYNFYANKVFLVLRPGSVKNATVHVFLDDKLIDASHAGSDVVNGVITIDSDRLYNLVDLKGVAGNHMLRLEFDSAGTEIFAFTFG